jgi:diaminohydroxyphosphoribosylaminopyrimidine deaminase/5-amino-6-(5-phosphoribosylamino)uracil reductase
MDSAAVARLVETAFQRAELGRGWVEPNPRVGALALSGVKVVGRGHHAEYGGPHAEIAALEDARRRGHDVDGMVVTLEPCGTEGKTPPCSEALVRAGVKTLIHAASDPNPENAGRALPLLRSHGVSVVHHPADERFRAQNRPYLRFLARRRPWTVVKWAMTLDGRSALTNGDSKWVSGDASRRLVHRLRGRCEAVAVGVSTVLRDDPLLTCRGEGILRKPPARVVFDSMLRTPVNATIVVNKEAPTWILTVASAPHEKRKALTQAGVEVLDVEADPSNGGQARVDLTSALALLWRLGIRRLLVESGPELAGALRAADLVDQYAVFVAPKIAGGANDGLAGAPEAPAMALARALDDVYIERVGDDVLVGGFTGLDTVR